jgi:hypothetical protein
VIVGVRDAVGVFVTVGVLEGGVSDAGLVGVTVGVWDGSGVCVAVKVIGIGVGVLAPRYT